MPFRDIERRKDYQRLYQAQRRRRQREREQAISTPPLTPYIEQVKAALEGLKTAVAESGQATRLEPWRNKVYRETLKTLQAVSKMLEALGNRV